MPAKKSDVVRVAEIFSGVFAAAVAALLALKVCQVHVASASSGIKFDSILNGIANRLDDGSFWAIVAAAYGSLLLLVAGRVLRGPSESPKYTFALYPWVAFAGTLLSLYLMVVFMKNETFFYTRSADARIVWIQLIEGVIVAGVILAAPYFLCFGMRVFRDAIEIPDKDCRRSAKALGYVLSSASAPLSSVMLMYTAVKTIKWIGGKPSPFAEMNFYLGALILVLYFSPFLVLFIVVAVSTYRQERFQITLLWFSVATMLWRAIRWLLGRVRSTSTVPEVVVLAGDRFIPQAILSLPLGIWVQVKDRPATASEADFADLCDQGT